MDQGEGAPKRESTFPLFSKFFITHPQDVVEHLGSMKKQMDDFIDAFKKRIDVQMTYSKNLSQVSKALDKYIKPGTQLTTSFICSAFKVEHQMRSRQSLELAESIKTEIEVMCTQMLKKQSTFHKKFEKDVKKYYKEGSNVEDDHRQALSRFQGINRQMQEMIITKNIMKYTSGIPQQKKLKLISKTMESIRQNKEYQKIYIQSVKSFNKFAAAYNTQITSQLDQAQNLVRDQVSMQADCIRKLIVAEASLFKNIQYDIVNISTQMEGLDTQRQAQIFVQQAKYNQNTRIVQQKYEQESKRGSLGETDEQRVQAKKIVGKSMLSNSLLYVDEEYFSWMLFNKRNKKLRTIVAGIWKELNSKMTYPSQNENHNLVQDKPKPEINEEKVESVQEKKEEGEEKKKEEGEEKKQVVEESIDKEGKDVKQDQQDNKEQKQEHIIQKDWQQQLKQLLQTFKVQQPPNILLIEGQKKSVGLTVDAAIKTFMEIMRIISELWNVQEFDTQLVNSKLEILQKCISEHHLYRLIAMMFLQEYRIQLEVMIKDDSCAKMCSKVLKSIIKESHKEKDTFIIRAILGLVFTFYWIDDKHKKLIYMNPDVYQCDIWKKNDFWQAAIFQTTYEEMALFSKQKGETGAQTTLREKNIIFSQLASFCHYMVMLGITSKKVRLIVGRYCRLYQMSEQQNKDLSKMITNTTKQFKETAAQFSLKQEKQKSVINE